MAAHCGLGQSLGARFEVQPFLVFRADTGDLAIAQVYIEKAAAATVVTTRGCYRIFYTIEGGLKKKPTLKDYARTSPICPT